MIFTPEKYSIADERMKPFIDPNELWNFIHEANPSRERILAIIAKSISKRRLNLEEVACLLKADTPELIAEIKQGANKLKKMIYGNRIVLFAPLYIGNKCLNDCTYCGFRTSNADSVRKTLSKEELTKEIESLEEQGQKRLILVFGEHPQYDPAFIAQSVQIAYGVKKANGQIRRVNINAAPLDIEGFKIVKASGIGTYQIFQETYHPDAYKTYHLRGRKSDYDYRLTSLDRAQEGGIDDVGIGVLFGLYDWKFEVMGLVRHVNHMEACYGVGPHTISFPRIKDSSGNDLQSDYMVNDEDFATLVAILRLAVPYTGMILTAREPAWLRDQIIQLGISQIDGGTKIELGSYSEKANTEEQLNRGQFQISDHRSLNEIIDELLGQDMIPSFCTACYRLGRTGEHFMEFSVPGFIKRYCTPNAILSLAEYLVDYAPPATARKGWEVIHKNIETLEDATFKTSLLAKIEQIKLGKRDLYL